MPNRKERRSRAAQARRSAKGPRQVFGFEVNDAERKRIYEVTKQPGYRELLDELMAAALEWRVLYPESVLTWKDTRGVLITADLGDEYNKGYLAKSDGAFDLLTFMDEKTGHKATTMMCQFVLGSLGWMPR